MLIRYCKAEARGLLVSNTDITRALVAALIEKGALVTDEIDGIISDAGRSKGGGCAGMIGENANETRRRSIQNNSRASL
jgi:hypothetical protein